jgi:hypothetical protein
MGKCPPARAIGQYLTFQLGGIATICNAASTLGGRKGEPRHPATIPDRRQVWPMDHRTAPADRGGERTALARQVHALRLLFPSTYPCWSRPGSCPRPSCSGQPCCGPSPVYTASAGPHFLPPRCSSSWARPCVWGVCHLRRRAGLPCHADCLVRGPYRERQDVLPRLTGHGRYVKVRQ